MLQKDLKINKNLHKIAVKKGMQKLCQNYRKWEPKGDPKSRKIHKNEGPERGCKNIEIY